MLMVLLQIIFPVLIAFVCKPNVVNLFTNVDLSLNMQFP